MESTLSLKKSHFEGEVGLFLGYGRGTANGDEAWDTLTEATIKSIVNSGYRQFIFPPAIDGNQSPYDWSFLKPEKSLTLASGSRTLALPDDCGAGIEGNITVSSSDSSCYQDVCIVNEGVIRMMFADAPDSTGYPQYAAIRPTKGTAQNHGQTFELYIYPEADADYTLTFTYYVIPDALTDNYPYCYGGAAHAETILESCLAIAEERLDDQHGGVHGRKFRERLIASIGLDRRMKPQKLGYNGDRTEKRYRRERHGWIDAVTFGGVEYS